MKVHSMLIGNGKATSFFPDSCDLRRANYSPNGSFELPPAYFESESAQLEQRNRDKMTSLLQLESYRPTGLCVCGCNSLEPNQFPSSGDADNTAETSFWWETLTPSCHQPLKLFDIDGSYKERVLNDVLEMEQEYCTWRRYTGQQQQHQQQLQQNLFNFFDEQQNAAVDAVDVCLGSYENKINVISDNTDDVSTSSSSSSVERSFSSGDEDAENEDSELSPAPSPAVSRSSRGRHGRPVRPRRRKRQLYQFLKEILENPDCNPTIITWVSSKDNIFRFVQPKQVAELWGRRRQRDGMTYEHLSRAMRYYYSRNVMKRAPAHGRLVYQFL